jgi:N-acetylgalactosamine-N,N'-diacetylbacillosaminyl-diphospho-undecaprenol 4-alpha-N-acetylgalactosaminyltransferase
MSRAAVRPKRPDPHLLAGTSPKSTGSGAVGSAIKLAGRRPKVLFLINSLRGGGAERVFATILSGSCDRAADYDVAAALLDEEPGAYALPSWVRTYSLDCRGNFALSVVRLLGLERRLRPDVTVSFLTRSNVAAAAAARLLGGRAIISERNNTTEQLSHRRASWLARTLVRFTYGRADRVISVSDGLSAALHSDYGVPVERLRTINNPVDIHALNSAARQRPAFRVRPDDVVMLARLEPQKNLHLAIRAFAASGRPGRLLILGEGTLRPELRALGTNVGLGKRLVMPGFVANPHAVLARAALLMLSSDHEGFCNSLVEAMALGLPVIATDCRFSPAEILAVTESPEAGQVVLGNGGLLVPVRDEAALASALSVANDSALLSRLAEDASARARDFDCARQVERYWDVVAEVAPARDRVARAA